MHPLTAANTPSLPTLAEALPATPSAAPDGSFTRPRQVEFLQALAACGAVRRASGHVGISYRTAYRERRASPAFRRAWDAALLSARALSEDVLATRALDGVEEEVMYHGEVVATRRRYDSRLLLAHLARLDKLTEDARTRAFAEDYEGALERFAAGIDDPAPVCEACGEALVAAGQRGADEAGAVSPPGLCDKCDSRKAEGAGGAAALQGAAEPCEPCPLCGGACEGPEDALTEADCQWFGNRLARMNAARPHGVPKPYQFPGGDPDGALDYAQMLAFEAGEEAWWEVGS